MPTGNAYVVDERSLCYLRVADPLGYWLLLGQLPALHRLGAPVGHYLDTEDVVWASRDMVAISVQQPGARTIQLPRAADVSDLYQATEIGRGVRSFSADFKDRSTRVFVLR